ncbi:MAG: thiol peroxidase [Verrucomicrobia bacterium]|nr:thiol peroxidase [Verrucomicrobiota bacterium]
MGTVTFKGKPVPINGQLPKVGAKAPPFTLTRQDLSDVTLETYQGKVKLLNIFPSFETTVCSLSVQTFYKEAAALPIVVLHISKDLPFAASRFCSSAELKNAETLSAFRSSFAIDYGLEITAGPMKGLCSRAVVVLDEDNKVLYVEQVGEITHEPNYEIALKAAT